MTITQIQRLYPAPVSATNPDATENPEHYYCIGGAICLAHAESEQSREPFPSGLYLADVLNNLNPCLTPVSASDFALAIIGANDTGDFEHAWRLAALALGDTSTVQ